MKPSHSILRILLPLGLALGLAAAAADAAPRTVCFRLQIRDDRTNCPTPGTPGVKRACNPGDYTDFVGARVELWDRDSGEAVNDEYIGTWVVGGPGVRCATFEWENASYAHGELHPDVYPRLRFEARHTNGSGAIVQAVTATGQSRGVMTWRAYALPNCQGTCTFAGTHVPTTSTTSDTAVSFMIVDAAQRVLQMYAPDMEGGTIKAWFPLMNNPDGVSCGTGLAWSRTDFCLPPGGKAKEGDCTTHEMGHIVQMHMFHQDYLQDVIKGGSWNMSPTSVESESGATTEGWAAYVAAVAWYDPNNSATTPFYFSADIEDATLAKSTCSANRNIPLQVAKAFWDFDDSNNEAGTRALVADDDRHDMTTGSIARRWEDFSDGTGNRADYESDENGVNLRDYLWYLTTSNASETLLEHNCLTAQDNN